MKKAAKEKPKLNQVRFNMTEEMECDIELLFATIVGKMKEKRVKGHLVNEFIRAYFDTREKGRDELMKLFRSWVALWPVKGAK